MNRKRSQLQAYFAGIFDGEGHVAIQDRPDAFVCNIVIAMNDPHAVLLVKKEYPDAYVGTRVNASGTTSIIVQFSQHKAYEFLKELLPFLLIKHEQVKVALSFLAHRRRDHTRNMKGMARGTSLPRCARCYKYHAALHTLRAEAKRVKTVNLHDMWEYRAKPEDVAEDVRATNALLRELLEGVETRKVTGSSQGKTYDEGTSGSDGDVIGRLKHEPTQSQELCGQNDTFDSAA